MPGHSVHQTSLKLHQSSRSASLMMMLSPLSPQNELVVAQSQFDALLSIVKEAALQQIKESQRIREHNPREHAVMANEVGAFVLCFMVLFWPWDAGLRDYLKGVPLWNANSGRWLPEQDMLLKQQADRDVDMYRLLMYVKPCDLICASRILLSACAKSCGWKTWV